MDFEILLHDWCKNNKISSWGLGSWDPATKEHMMAYDKQLDFYNDVQRGSNSLREGDEIQILIVLV